MQGGDAQRRFENDPEALPVRQNTVSMSIEW